MVIGKIRIPPSSRIAMAAVGEENVPTAAAVSHRTPDTSCPKKPPT